MKQKQARIAILAVGMALWGGLARAAATSNDIDLVSICKTDCPEAKSNTEAHECAERKGKIRVSFKKSKCWEENEKYEKLVEAEGKSKAAKH